MRPCRSVQFCLTRKLQPVMAGRVLGSAAIVEGFCFTGHGPSCSANLTWQILLGQYFACFLDLYHFAAALALCPPIAIATGFFFFSLFFSFYCRFFVGLLGNPTSRTIQGIVADRIQRDCRRSWIESALWCRFFAWAGKVREMTLFLTPFVPAVLSGSDHLFCRNLQPWARCSPLTGQGNHSSHWPDFGMPWLVVKRLLGGYLGGAFDRYGAIIGAISAPHSVVCSAFSETLAGSWLSGVPRAGPGCIWLTGFSPALGQGRR